jgi:hypothetical protein
MWILMSCNSTATNNVSCTRAECTVSLLLQGEGASKALKHNMGLGVLQEQEVNTICSKYYGMLLLQSAQCLVEPPGDFVTAERSVHKSDASAVMCWPQIALLC